MKTKILSIALCIVMLMTATTVLVACDTEEGPITFSDASFMYDGFDHMIEVKGAPKDASISYSPSNVQKEVGTYEITATVTVDGEVTHTLKATMTIAYPDEYTLDTELDSELEELLALLNGSMEQLKAENDEKIAALKAECLAKIDQLTDESTTIKADLADLISAYEKKVAELEAADKANADNLAELEAQYAADLAALKKADNDNKAAIESLTATYEAKVAELEAADKANADNLAELEAQYAADLAALKKADNDNKAAIESLTATYEAKVAELEAADKANAENLAELEAQYNASVADLSAKLAANQAAIAQCKSDLESGVKQLTEKYDSEVSALSALITELKATDASNIGRIQELENKISGLLTTFTVSFDLNGGEGKADPQTVKKGEKAVAPEAPTREGYTFLGWYVGDEKWSFIGYTVTEDITLTAKWLSTDILGVAENCAVEDGKLTVLTGYPCEYVDVKSKITVDPQCSVSLFADSALTTLYPYCRMTGLKAGENKAYMIIESADGKSSAYDVTVFCLTADFMSEGKMFITSELGADLLVNAPETTPESSLPGYEFAGWSVNGEQVTFPYTVGIDTVFNAIYTPISYKITYVLNGGTLPTDYTEAYTVESGASLPQPKRSLHLFDGWYESEKLTGNKLTSIPKGEYGDKTYYAKWLSATGGITYSLSSGSKYYTVTGYEGEDTEVVIPDSVEGIPVTAIANEAFKDKQRIASITLPNNVTSIGYNAFQGCISLETLKLGNNVKSIPNSMAYGCNKLQSIVIPDSVTSIGSSAFSRCSSLTSVVIPNSVTSIGNWAFYYCDSLTSVVIPDSVNSIGDYAFSYCDSLTNVVIGNSVTSIGDSAFYGCNSLISVELGNSVTSIGKSTFEYCSSLASVIIPDNVTSIGSYAFQHCGINSVVIGKGITSICVCVFGS
ncbi:MAG: leucine-rich repeat protein [Clostridia bacterium]|nr:leucine-rich repeat protein [Clostridia bacterium]